MKVSEHHVSMVLNHIGGQVLSVEVGTNLLMFSLIPRPSAICVYHTGNQTSNHVDAKGVVQRRSRQGVVNQRRFFHTLTVITPCSMT